MALAAVTTNGNNTAVGSYALNVNTGSYNTAVGRAALTANTTGVSSTAVGYASLDANTTGTNDAFGNLSLSTNTTGTQNSAFGHSSSFSVTTGNYNTAMGYGAGYYVSTGTYNTAIGRAADQVTTTGSYNICIGPSAKPSGAGGSSETAIGYNTTGNGGSTFLFGSGTTDTSCAFGGTTWSNPSDERIKEEIEDEVVGLSFINDLRPRTFRYRQEKDIPEELDAHVAGSEKRYKTDEYEHGFIAQEVKEAIDKHSSLKDGFDMWKEDPSDGRQRVGETAVIPMLVKAIQELSAEIEKLKGA